MPLMEYITPKSPKTKMITRAQTCVVLATGFLAMDYDFESISRDIQWFLARLTPWPSIPLMFYFNNIDKANANI